MFEGIAYRKFQSFGLVVYTVKCVYSLAFVRLICADVTYKLVCNHVSGRNNGVKTKLFYHFTD